MYWSPCKILPVFTGIGNNTLGYLWLLRVLRPYMVMVSMWLAEFYDRYNEQVAKSIKNMQIEK